jgi:ribonuclease BN (tRNA processing enzyme)
MRVRLLGTRGSIPTPGARFVKYGGNTSCVSVARDGELPSLMLDAGSGLATAGPLFGAAPFRGSILLGHLHWDHVYGLPFFPAADKPDARVCLYIPAQGDPYEALARPLSPPAFPIDVRGLRGDWHIIGLEPGAFEAEGFNVLAAEIPHKGGRTFGYRIDDGVRSLAYLSDHSPTDVGNGPDGIGEYHDAALALATGVDLLIHDAQYAPDELARKIDWGHCSYRYPIELGRRAGARRTMLFHHDPGHDDETLDAIAARLIDEPGVSLAVEGTVLDL